MVLSGIRLERRDLAEMTLPQLNKRINTLLNLLDDDALTASEKTLVREEAARTAKVYNARVSPASQNFVNADSSVVR